MNRKERVIILDSKPLGEICNPINQDKIKPLIEFLRTIKISLRVAKITDYELRRELTLQGLTKGIRNLNKFKQRQEIIPIDSESLFLATELWAKLRRDGQPTADSKNIDCDVIMVAQALKLQKQFEQIIILTIDIKDLIRFRKFGIEVWDWKQALSDCKYQEINLYNP
ncbi:MAG: hypothetical protein AAF298_24060 [Cyanobacteria bacterium P01_A01_bin.40]